MIHPTAMVSRNAKLDSTVEVGPYAIIEDHVQIGRNTKIMSHAYITGYTEIGERNVIHMGAVIGHLPQDLKFRENTVSYLKIGSGNTFREYSTVHRGTEPESVTIIGNDNFLMGGAHVAHNCVLGHGVIMCNYSMLGGHVHVADRAFISGGVAIHQYIRVGRLVMISGGASITMDVPPFVTVCERNQIRSLNLIGMQRANFSNETIKEIKKVYRIFYLSELNTSHALKKIEQSELRSPEVGEFVEFIRQSKKGVALHRQS